MLCMMILLLVRALSQLPARTLLMLLLYLLALICVTAGRGLQRLGCGEWHGCGVRVLAVPLFIVERLLLRVGERLHGFSVLAVICVAT